ncbi:MAG: flagellar biosynthesis protein FlhB [Candidatus Dactylopiibacterium sp.]|nr:flagellar biosynthesis protein FlhB [Candidatus Dactylopiibacterium sp.]
MAEDSDLEKTEPASPRRIEKAREEGNVPQSRELSTFLVLMTGVCTLWAISGWATQRVRSLLEHGLSFGRTEAFSQGFMYEQLVRLSTDALLVLAPFFFVMVIASLGAPVLLGGFVFSTQAMGLKLDRLNPISGLGRLVSLQSAVELVKGVLKSLLVGCIGAWALWAHRGEILALSTMPLVSGLTGFGHVLLVCSLTVVAGLALVAGVDVPFQLWRYYDQLKMTKEEVKQEFKEQEGDPQLKGRIRARQREMARRRMMAEVPKADVVVTNPTHFAVALKYEAANMGAPKVVAKGADLVAAAIRELAAEHKVPLLEAPPLARALFRHTEVGEQIPAGLYTAVAEVMAYVFQLNHFLAEGGEAPELPRELAVPPGMDPGAPDDPAATTH